MPSNRRAGAVKLATLLVSLATLAACSGSPTGPSAEPPTPLTLSLLSGVWQAIGEPAPFALATNSSAHLEFDFPVSGSLHYLHTPSALAAGRAS